MAKRRGTTLPATEMTSMIDIIFQLLIFFLVTLSLGTVQERASAEVQGEMVENLPELPPMEKLTDTQELTEGFLLHIDENKEKEVKGDLVCYILDPEFRTAEEAAKDSSGLHGPFDLKTGGQKLRRHISEKRLIDGIPPTLAIRAHAETPYGFILDIMSFCNEDSIEFVDFHFAKVREGAD